MQQWREIKSRHPDALLFFRVGDFYEMFYGDAEEGARLLDLTLTSRNNGSSRAPLAGIPVHALDTYLQRLVRLGRRVAICEQVEDPAQAKGIVRREVVETVTPGTALNDALLSARRNNFIAAISGSPADRFVAVAAADLSTGELRVQSVTSEELRDHLARIEPAELLLPRSWELFPIAAAEGAVRTYRSDWLFEAVSGAEEMRRHYGVLSLDGFGFGAAEANLAGACGGLLGYLAETQPTACRAMRAPQIVTSGDEMRLDEMTRRNLELIEPLNGRDGGATLLRVLDEALTPMGGRLLRRWLLAPLLRLDAMEARLTAVDELVERTRMRSEVRTVLRGIRDMERLATKLASTRCTPRDLLSVAESLAAVDGLRSSLSAAESALLLEHIAGLDPIDELRSLIEKAIHPEAPVLLSEGSVIRTGFDGPLDDLRATRDGAIDWIAQLQARERERSGIQSLKVGFNRVFGYYLEVTRSKLDRVPEDYQRKQTLANAERYITPELKEWEAKVLGAEERILELESRLFEEVRMEAAGFVARLQAVSAHVAGVDVLAGFAETAVQREYVRPVVDEGYDLEIRGGRHAVVETMMPREDFIPNDVVLGGEERVMILTGPNMAGKSTVLRQVGLIVLLAQVGSFVPARSAHVGVVDRLFTRVGASDNLVRGQSTFMVEMNETAAILHGATDRSLVLLDEIGRGTSTWDGLSVATAVTEFIHDSIGAKTIFATHYHELTALDARLEGIVNFSVAVKEEGEQIIFLRTLVPGGADRSYGVEVARLAGLPPEVIGRARTLLLELERATTTDEGRHSRGVVGAESQLQLFEAPPHPVVERLRGVNPDQMTPLQALALLADLAAQARS